MGYLFNQFEAERTDNITWIYLGDTEVSGSEWAKRYGRQQLRALEQSLCTPGAIKYPNTIRVFEVDKRTSLVVVKTGNLAKIVIYTRPVKSSKKKKPVIKSETKEYVALVHGGAPAYLGYPDSYGIPTPGYGKLEWDDPWFAEINSYCLLEIVRDDGGVIEDFRIVKEKLEDVDSGEEEWGADYNGAIKVFHTAEDETMLRDNMDYEHYTIWNNRFTTPGEYLNDMEFGRGRTYWPIYKEPTCLYKLLYLIDVESFEYVSNRKALLEQIAYPTRMVSYFYGPNEQTEDGEDVLPITHLLNDSGTTRAGGTEDVPWSRSWAEVGDLFTGHLEGPTNQPMMIRWVEFDEFPGTIVAQIAKYIRTIRKDTLAPNYLYEVRDSSNYDHSTDRVSITTKELNQVFTSHGILGATHSYSCKWYYHRYFTKGEDDVGWTTVVGHQEYVEAYNPQKSWNTNTYNDYPDKKLMIYLRYLHLKYSTFTRPVIDGGWNLGAYVETSCEYEPIEDATLFAGFIDYSVSVDPSKNGQSTLVDPETIVRSPVLEASLLLGINALRAGYIARGNQDNIGGGFSLVMCSLAKITTEEIDNG